MTDEQRAEWDARLLAAHDEARAAKSAEQAARLAWLKARQETRRALERLARVLDLREGDEPLFDHLVEQARPPAAPDVVAADREREDLAERLIDQGGKANPMASPERGKKEAARRKKLHAEDGAQTSGQNGTTAANEIGSPAQGRICLDCHASRPWELERCPSCQATSFKPGPYPPPDVYGYDLVVSLNTGGEERCHYAGTEKAARKKALMRPHAKEVISAEPLTEEQYVRAYGRARRGG